MTSGEKYHLSPYGIIFINIYNNVKILWVIFRQNLKIAFLFLSFLIFRKNNFYWKTFIMFSCIDLKNEKYYYFLITKWFANILVILLNFTKFQLQAQHKHMIDRYLYFISYRNMFIDTNILANVCTCVIY